MPRIVVFDSGLGSLSIIRPIQKRIKLEIVYFADQKNFPYGTKSVYELKKIILSIISKLEKTFMPDLIVIGSNTPSLLLKNIFQSRIIGVVPPIKKAVNHTKTRSIAILVTKSVSESHSFKNYIKKNVPNRIKVNIINASLLVNLVESGKFIDEIKLCRKIIEKELKESITTNNIDVITLSSTHLPFLLPIFKKVFPNVKFLDPADTVVDQIIEKLNKKESKRNSLKIFASGNVKTFQKKLLQIGIKNIVKSL